MTTLKKSFVAVLACSLFAAVFSINPARAEAVTCVFNRNLFLGSSGSDVQCLQSWLAGQGYFNGPQTGYFGQITASAVARWQLANRMSPTGRFQFMSLSQGSGFSNRDGTIRGSQQDAISALEDAVDAYSDAIRDVEDAGNDTDADDARNDLDDAQQSFILAFRAFADGDYLRAEDHAQDAQNSAEDASDRAGGRTSRNNSTNDRNDALTAINDAEDDIANAQDDINRSDSSSSRIRNAEDTLDEARDALDDASSAYDDADYDEAVDGAEMASGLARDAQDEL